MAAFFPGVKSVGVSRALPGTYTLMLQVREGVHATARNAVVVNVMLPVLVMRAGNDAIVGFESAVGQTYRVERTTDPANGPWTTIADNLAGGRCRTTEKGRPDGASVRIIDLWLDFWTARCN